MEVTYIKNKTMKLIRCDKSQYLKKLDTEKAYAVQYSRFGDGNIMFLSKKFVKMKEETEDDIPYFWFEIPDWQYEIMNDVNKQDIALFEADTLQRIIEHDAKTKPKRWYSDRETDNILKPFG